MSDPAAAARFQRASALEEKRRKLDELKKKREVRGADTARIQATQATTNLDEYIDDLLKDSSGSVTSAAVTVVATVENEGQSQIHRDSARDPNENGTSSTAVPVPTSSTFTTTSTTTSTSATSTTDSTGVEHLRKQIEVFSISTQTEDELLEDENDDSEAKRKNDEDAQNKAKAAATEATSDSQSKTTDNSKHDAVEPKILSIQEVEREVTKQPFSLFLNTASKKVERMLVATSLATSTSSTQLSPTDMILADYVTESIDIDRHREQQLHLMNTDGGIHTTLDTKFVQSKVIYECPKWTNHRDVTDLDWSPIHRELLLSTYYSINSALPSSTASTTNLESGNVVGTRSNHTNAAFVSSSSSLTPRSGELLSDGLALIWSPMLPHRPEHVFTCGTPVMCGKFHPTDPTLIIGGCYSGQLVIWDIRSGRLPVQKSAIPTGTTSLSSSSSTANQPPMMKGHHAHSIGSMEILDGGVSKVARGWCDFTSCR
jgi:dynein intermediate chain